MATIVSLSIKFHEKSKVLFHVLLFILQKINETTYENAFINARLGKFSTV